jgi:DNA processing protein
VARLYPEKSMEAAMAIIGRIRESNTGIIHYWDDDYPPRLRSIRQPPIVLYYLGARPLESPSVAIVGTRHPRERSLYITERLVRALVAARFAVVSGMARGIDGASHERALSEGGRTIGILANGIDIVYPLMNRHIYDRIRASPGSSLVSEYPPGTVAGRWTFVRRNRIISALSQATVVVEAGRRSGALITAGYAAEQGRDVFVCPGPALDEAFHGCNRLIEEGAGILYDIERFMEGLTGRCGYGQLELFVEPEATPPPLDFPGDPREVQILRFLSAGAADTDTVIRQCRMPVHEFHEALVLLEAKGLVSRRGNILSAVRR